MIKLSFKNPDFHFRRWTAGIVLLTFVSTTFIPPAQAQGIIAPSKELLSLPTPGSHVLPSKSFLPPTLKGMTIHSDNPFLFEFFVDHGDKRLGNTAFKEESQKLIKYFLAALTVPEKEMWVNLSPDDPDRIISKNFGQTEMGRDLLAQDYILKQLTASLMDPEKEWGKIFWQKIYQQARARFGTTRIPVNTFHKVWIIPDTAGVYVKDNHVFVVENHLKVLLEDEYLKASSKNSTNSKQQMTTDIVREIILPAIEREVNEGEHFVQLRQIYNAVILATWYKRNLKESLLNQTYADQEKIEGIDVDDKEIDQKIYQRYLEAFQKGVYHSIREEIDPATKQLIPRKYFTGGSSLELAEGSPRQYGDGGQPLDGKRREALDETVRAAAAEEVKAVTVDLQASEAGQDARLGQASSSVVNVDEAIRRWVADGHGNLTVRADDGAEFEFRYEERNGKDQVINVYWGENKVGYVHFYVNGEEAEVSVGFPGEAFLILGESKRVFREAIVTLRSEIGYGNLGASLMALAMRVAREKGAHKFSARSV
ncbi:MAG: hypothetical protein NUV91_06995, partial [Candidatus Omnitrophica bacterium]|nr:hypothetical protein [Candidatus Omnitrophota bacterium]